MTVEQFDQLYELGVVALMMLGVIAGAVVGSVLWRKVTAIIVCLGCLGLSGNADDATIQDLINWLNTNLNGDSMTGAGYGVQVRNGNSGNFHVTVDNLPDPNTAQKVELDGAIHVIVDTEGTPPPIDVTVNFPEDSPNVPSAHDNLDDGKHKLDDTGSMDSLRGHMAGMQGAMRTNATSLTGHFNGKIAPISDAKNNTFTFPTVSLCGTQYNAEIDLDTGWMGEARTMIRGICLWGAILAFWFLGIKTLREGI